MGFVVLLGRTPGTVHHGRAGGRLTTGTSVVRAAYHPDFHRRSRISTWSTGRWLRSGRGLSPPARSFTDPGARAMKYAAHRGAVSRVVCCGFPHPPAATAFAAKPRGPGRGAGAALWACCTRPPTASADSRARRRGAGARSRSTSTVARCTGRSTRCTPPWSAGSGSRCAWPTGNATGTPRCASPAAWFACGTDQQGIRELPFAWELPVEVDADGFVVHRPVRTSDDPMWQDYQWVAMLDPVELADGVPRDPGPSSGPDAALPPALVVHRLDAAVRHGRETWWAEVAPLEEYAPAVLVLPAALRPGQRGVEDRHGGGPTMRSRDRSVSRMRRPTWSRSTSRPASACTSSTSTATTPAAASRSTSLGGGRATWTRTSRTGR